MSNSQKPVPETKVPLPTVDVGETSTEQEANLITDTLRAPRPESSKNPTIVNN